MGLRRGPGGRPRWRRAARRAARAPAPPWATALRSSRSFALARASTSCFPATRHAGRVQPPPRPRRRRSPLSPLPDLPQPQGLAPRALRRPRRPPAPDRGPRCPPSASAWCALASPMAPGSRPPRPRDWVREETASVSTWAASFTSTPAAAAAGANG